MAVHLWRIHNHRMFGRHGSSTFVFSQAHCRLRMLMRETSHDQDFQIPPFSQHAPPAISDSSRKFSLPLLNWPRPSAKSCRFLSVHLAPHLSARAGVCTFSYTLAHAVGVGTSWHILDRFSLSVSILAQTTCRRYPKMSI